MAWVPTSPLIKRYTLDEFWMLDDPPDRMKAELIAGVIYLTPPPDYLHDNLVSRVASLVISQVTETRTGTMYFPRAAICQPPDTHLEPDLFYVSAKLQATFELRHRTSADLAVEVVSVGSEIYDRNTKADTYAALGVRELWLIDEKSHTVEVRTNTAGRFGPGVVYRRGEIVVSAVFPDLSLPVDSIFND